LTVVQPPDRRFQASAWGWAAIVATAVSAFGYALQTILDYVPAPTTFKFAEFWGLFAGDAVISFLTGLVAVITGWRSRRRDATIAFGLIGIGWLLLAQAIQIVWD
jgi:hypothetical protein